MLTGGKSGHEGYFSELSLLSVSKNQVSPLVVSLEESKARVVVFCTARLRC